MIRCRSKYRWTFLLSLLATISNGCLLAPMHETTQLLECEYLPGAALHVTSENGSISVQESDRINVGIIAQIRAQTPQRLEATLVTAEEAVDGSLSVFVVWPEGRRKNREGCSFEIQIPGANGVDLQTSNGRLEAVGLGGKAELRTSNGAIRVERHRGTIQAQTSNGKIEITGASENVTAHTSNGSVHVGLQPDATGPIDVKTSNGRIELEVGPSFSGSLQLQTSNGSIDANDVAQAEIVSATRRQVRLAFQEGQPPSTATTSNGSIRVRSVRLSEAGD